MDVNGFTWISMDLNRVANLNRVAIGVKGVESGPNSLKRVKWLNE